MDLLKDKTLVLFFTLGVSLEQWDQLGIINRELAIYKNLSEHFKEIILITYGNQNDEQYANILPKNMKIVWAGKKSSFLFSLYILLKYRDILRKADYYKSNQMVGSWVCALAKILYQKKFILRYGYQWSWTYKKNHNFNPKILLIYLIEFFVYVFSDAIIITSNEMKVYVRRIYRLKSIVKKIVVIPNYVDTSIFCRSNNGIRKGICAVGRLSPEKNLDALIHACSKNNIKLTIVGDGILRNDLEQFAANLNMDVIFTGIVPNQDIPNIINKHKIFAQVSFYEGNPKTILEAMSCSLPIIGSNVTGIKETVEDNKTGVLCGTDVDSIAQAIECLIQNERKMEEFGENARHYVEKNNSLLSIAMQELEVYQNLICDGEIID